MTADDGSRSDPGEATARDALPPTTRAATGPGLSERLDTVERRVEELARELARLREELGS